MSTEPETGEITGTKDKDYNLIWFTEKCLDNVLRLENYIQDADRADDDELATSMTMSSPPSSARRRARAARAPSRPRTCCASASRSSAMAHYAIVKVMRTRTPG